MNTVGSLRVYAIALCVALGMRCLPAADATKELQPAVPPQTLSKFVEITDEHRDFLKRAEALLKNVGLMAAREFAMRLNAPETIKFRDKLAKGEVERGDWYSWQWGEVKNAVTRAEKGADWPAMPTVTVPRAERGAIRVDGVLDEAAWKQAVTFSGEYQFNTKALREGNTITWKMLWDDEFLYVAYDCLDATLTAKNRDRDDDVWADDCVEIFILPDIRFRTYWELVVSPAGSVFDSVQCKLLNQWGCNSDIAQNIDGLKTGIVLNGTLNAPEDTDVGYRVELAIPFSQLPGFTRAPAREGDTLRFMLVRLDKDAKGQGAYSFQPLLGWGHNIWNHAPMILGPKP